MGSSPKAVSNTAIYYVPQSKGGHSSANAGICTDWEQLIGLLEKGNVNALLVDHSIPPQERNSIFGWARIFIPNIRCQVARIEVSHRDIRVLEEEVA